MLKPRLDRIGLCSKITSTGRLEAQRNLRGVSIQLRKFLSFLKGLIVMHEGGTISLAASNKHCYFLNCCSHPWRIS